ncbi:MAG: FecR family protein [Nitrospirota bacterium]
MKIIRAIITTMIFAAVMPALASAKDEAGIIVSVKNRAIIERENREINAKAKDEILAVDTVSTLEASRAKMLFRDDSVLTLGENSKVVIKEYMYSEGRRGKSVFNLIDGKMRAVVGNTNFEVHTPTAVAAARGTVILFDTGKKHGKYCTTCIGVEGKVDVKSRDHDDLGSVILEPGKMTVVCAGEAPTLPEIAPAAIVDSLSKDTDVGSRHEITVPEPVETGAAINFTPEVSGPPPVVIDQQPAQTETPVRINIKFQ